MNLVGLQMISRDTSFLRCQADRQTVLLDSDFELWVKWRWVTKKLDSPARVENKGVGTAEEIVSLRFLA